MIWCVIIRPASSNLKTQNNSGRTALKDTNRPGSHKSTQFLLVQLVFITGKSWEMMDLGCIPVPVDANLVINNLSWILVLFYGAQKKWLITTTDLSHAGTISVYPKICLSQSYHNHAPRVSESSGQISPRPHTTDFPQMVVIVREMGPLISGKSRLVKYYFIWPDSDLLLVYSRFQPLSLDYPSFLKVETIIHNLQTIISTYGRGTLPWRIGGCLTPTRQSFQLRRYIIFHWRDTYHCQATSVVIVR